MADIDAIAMAAGRNSLRVLERAYADLGTTADGATHEEHVQVMGTLLNAMIFPGAIIASAAGETPEEFGQSAGKALAGDMRMYMEFYRRRHGKS